MGQVSGLDPDVLRHLDVSQQRLRRRVGGLLDVLPDQVHQRVEFDPHRRHSAGLPGVVLGQVRDQGATGLVEHALPGGLGLVVARGRVDTAFDQLRQAVPQPGDLLRDLRELLVDGALQLIGDGVDDGFVVHDALRQPHRRLGGARHVVAPVQNRPDEPH